MKKLIYIFVALLSLVSSVAKAEDLRTSGKLTFWSQYWIQGYAKSTEPFTTIRGTAGYGPIEGYIESRQSISGNSQDSYMVGVIDYKFNKNFSIGYKSYNLQQLDGKQCTDIHYVARCGNWTSYTYMFLTSPMYGPLAKRFDNSVYTSISYSFKPVENTKVKLSTGFGNKANLHSDQSGLSMVNNDILVETKISNGVNLINMVTYNPYESGSFSFDKMTYIAGLSIEL